MTIGKRINLLILFLLLCVSAPIIALNAYHYRADMQRQLVQVQLPEISNSILSTLDTKIMEPSRGLGFAAQSPVLQQWIAQGEPNNSTLDTIYIFLGTIVQAYKTLGANFVSQATKQYTDLQNGKRDHSYRISDKDTWFSAFRDSNAPVGITVYVNDPTWGTKAFINRRVEGTSGYAGLLSVAIDLQDFARDLSQTTVGKQGLTFIADEQGIIRFFPDQTKVNAPINTILPAYATEWQRILGEESHSFSYRENGDTRFVISRKIPILGWYLFIEASGNEVLQSMWNSIYVSMGLSILLTIAGVLVGMVLVRSLVQSLRATAEFAQAISLGNLEQQLHVKREDEIGILAEALRRMVDSLKGQISEATEQKQNALKQMHLTEQAMQEGLRQQEKVGALLQHTLESANNAAQVSERVNQVAGSLGKEIEKTSLGGDKQYKALQAASEAMGHMASITIEVAQSATQTAHSAQTAKELAQQGATTVNSVIQAVNKVHETAQNMHHSMAELTGQTENISQILTIITDIADQTNLLALNAAIEAARAGDAGRGFAVVADEVRKLAEKTMAATKDVGQALTGIQHTATRNAEDMTLTAKAVEQASLLAHNSGEALHRIVQLSGDNADEINSFATTVGAMRHNSSTAAQGIEQVNAIALETIEDMQRSAALLETLIEQAKRLDSIIATLKQEKL